MRPTAKRQSALRAPLNSLLGTRANVRLLRILARTDEPITAPQLAREAELTAPGVYQALEGLRAAGVVERLGRGVRGQFRLRTQHPLAHALTSLFEAERRRVEALLDGLRVAAERLSPPPRSVLLVGSVAERTDGFADPLCIVVVAGSRGIAALTDTLQETLTELEARQDVTFEVRGLTDADLGALPDEERARLERGTVILGLPTDAYVRSTCLSRRREKRRYSGHPAHDARLLELAAAIAQKLKTDPSLADRALRYVRKRTRIASAGERKELREWERVLRTMSALRLRKFLVDRGPRATRLRQSLPFLDALSGEERKMILIGGRE